MNEAERITHRVKDEIHDCIAPDCVARARTAFIAQESGRFAGREIQAGDWIDLCAAHGSDVYSAQGRTASELPDWLRQDAKADPMDLVLGNWSE